MCDNLADLDLQYLINKEQYEKPIENHINNKKQRVKQEKRYNKDKKFYRKRILNLTKELFNDDCPDVNHDIFNIFNTYIKSCIDYFKHLDTNDIMQECFEDLNISSPKIPVNKNNKSNSGNNDLLIGNMKKPTNALEKLIKRIPLGNKNEMIIPKQKQINLKDPKLKDKGLEKKNIINNYDEENKNK
jgi:hypothetical protein